MNLSYESKHAPVADQCGFRIAVVFDVVKNNAIRALIAISLHLGKGIEAYVIILVLHYNSQDGYIIW